MQTQATEVPGETTTEQTTETSVETTAEETTEAATEETTEKATESETESETETEASYKNEFTYSTTDMNANVVLSGEKAMTDKASFVVEKKDKLIDVEYYTGAYNAVKQLVAAGGLEIADAAVFDVAFLVDGAETEPAGGTATVTMTFPAGLDVCAGQTAQVRAYHIVNGIAQDVTQSVTMTEDGKVGSVTILLNSFSPVVIAGLVQPTIEEVVEETAGADDVVALNAEISNNLNDFVTKVNVSGAQQDENGNLILYPGSSYKFDISFGESPDKQFNKTETLTYTFPGVLLPQDIKGQFSITVNDAGTLYTIGGNNYTISGNTITVNMNQEDPNFQRLKDASNASFHIEASAAINENAEGDQIDFGNSVSKGVIFDNDSSLQLEKNGRYDKNTGKFWYTVKATSTGTSRNVKIKDTISGDVLKYAKDLTVKSNKRGENVGGTVTATDKGFEYTLDSMMDGECLEFTYSADVDYTKLNGNKFTADNTKNTISADKDGDKDPEPDDWDYDNQTAYDLVSKAGELNNNDSTDDIKVLDWTITVNPDAKVAAGGKTVTDTIIPNEKAPMTYHGSGITVERYDASGNKVGNTETVAWNALGKTDSSWTYTIPKQDTTPYKYVIKYQTEVDVSEVVGSENVDNRADYDGGTSGGPTGVAGNGGVFDVAKAHGNVSKEGVDWTVTVTIPKKGLKDKLEITDTLPINNNNVSPAAKDSFIEGSLKVTLNGQEVDASNYTLTNTVGNQWEAEKFSVTFKNLETLFPKTSDNYELVLTYKTKPAENWPEADGHWNTVNVKADSLSGQKQDFYFLINPKIDKSSDGSETIDGLPTFKYKIQLQGVSSDSVVINDAFNTEIFEYYNKADYNKVVAGDNSWDWTDTTGKFTSDATDTGVKFTITPVTKKNGAYYNYYTLYYTLRVKDEAALKKLQQQAADNGGKVDVANKAAWGDVSDKVSAEYKIVPLSKDITDWPGTGNYYVATYKLTINPNKLELNGGNSIDVTDTFSESMSLMTDSVEVTLDGVVQSGYPYDFPKDKKGLSLQIPDKTTAVITYKAKIIGSQNTSYKNDAKITGSYDTSTGEKWVTIDTSGSGIASIIGINIIKRDEDNRTQTIGDVKFQLYREENGQFVPYLTSRIVQGDKVIVEGGAPIFFTTDEDGRAFIRGVYNTDGWTLESGKTYQLREIITPKGYKTGKPVTFKVADVVTAPGEYANGDILDIYNQKLGGIKLKKTDGKATPLAGAKFDLYRVKTEEENADVKVQSELVTDAQGEIALDNLEAGMYYFVETEAPTGYETPEGDAAKTATIEVKPGQTAAQATPVNVSNTAKKGCLQFTKTDSTGTAIEGAQFQILKNGTEPYSGIFTVSFPKTDTPATTTLQHDLTMTVTKEGLVTISGLEWGSYVLEEIKAPDGFVLSENSTYNFAINADTFADGNDEGIVLPGDKGKIVNGEDNGSLKIVKTVKGIYAGDAYTFYFTVEDEDGTYYDAAGNEADASGKILSISYPTSTELVISGLKKTDSNGVYKTYKVTEVDVDGKPLADAYEFTVDYSVNPETGVTFELTDEQQIEVTNTLKKGSAFFTKIDGVSKDSVSGAKFALYRADETAVNKLGARILTFTAAASTDVKYDTGFENAATVTYNNTSGQVRISDLRYGKYVLVETDAPKGYDTPVEDDARHSFEVDGNDVAIGTDGSNGEIGNNKSKGNIVVIKKVSGTTEQADLSKEFTFKFTFKDPDFDEEHRNYSATQFDLSVPDDKGTPLTVDFKKADDFAKTNNVVGEVELTHNQSVKISGIPVGVVYVVKETEAGDFVTQYKINSDAAVTGTIAEGKVESTGDETVLFTNTKKAVLNLAKDQIGGVDGTEFTVILEKEGNSGYEPWKDQSYTVVSADDSETNGTTGENGIIKIKGGQVVTIAVDTQNGAVKYRLKENTESEYKTPVYKKNGTIQTPVDDYVSGTVNPVSAGGTAERITWVIENTYDFGSISFTKVDGKDTNKLVAATFILEKKDSDGKYQEYLKFKVGTDPKPFVEKIGTFPENAEIAIDETNGATRGKVTISGLLWGTYRLEEVADGVETGYVGSYNSDTSYAEGIVIGSQKKEYSLSSGGSTSSDGKITNDKKVQDVSFKKTVEGPTSDQNASYPFEIYIKDGYEGKNGDGKNYSYNYTIRKTDGTESSDSSQIIEAYKKVTINLKGGETAVIKGLPYGAVFTVKESDVAGMSASVTPGTGTSKLEDGVGVTGQIGDVAPQNPRETEFVNTRLNNITFKKVQAGGKPDDEFTFKLHLDTPDGERYTVEYTDDDGKLLKRSTVTKGDNTIRLQGGMTATVKNVPYGTKYSIAETGNSAYTTTIGETEKLSTDELTANENDTMTTFTNTHKVGDLKLSKNVAEGDSSKWFKFTVNLTRQGIPTEYLVKYYNTANDSEITEEVMKALKPENPFKVEGTQSSVNIYLRNNMYAVIKDIETGIFWTVTEEKDSDYDTVVSVNGAEAKESFSTGTGQYIKENQGNEPANTAAFTNTIKKGSLSFKKVNVDGTKTDKFVFQIQIGTDADQLVPYKGSYTLIESKGSTSKELEEDDEGKVTITDGQTVKIENLPYGTKFEVKELLDEAPDTNVDEYYIGDEERTGTITAKRPKPEEEFWNNKFQNLIVTKSAIGGDENAVFTFQIRKMKPLPTSLDQLMEQSDACANMKFTRTGEGVNGDNKNGVTGADGKFTLKNGQSAHFEGLKQGETFVILELRETGYEIWDTQVQVDNGKPQYDTKADVTVGPNGAGVTFTNEGILASATFKKVDSVTKDPISGAKFRFYEVDEDGNESPIGEEFTVEIPENKPTDILRTDEVLVTIDTDGLVTIFGLEWGKYLLRETAAPEGYALPAVTDTEFVIDKETFKVETANPDNGQDGGASNTTEGGSAPAQPTVPVKSIGSIENAKTRVLIDKVDADKNETSLKNAHLQILDMSKDVAERVVAEWDSDGKPHEVKGLATGVTYTLHETIAPAGYELTKDTIFTLSANGTLNMDSTKTTVNAKDKVVDGKTVKVLLVEDKAIEIGFNKKDDKDAYLANAKLQIVVKDTKGDVVDSWISDGKSHDITGKLVGGESYILEELEAPTGYAVAEPIEFKVETDGTIIMGGQRLTSIDMVDAKLHFHVNKTVLGGEEEVAGAELTVIDKETGKVIDKWVSKVGKTYDFGEKLTAGKEYILRETVAPQGYAYTTDIDFKINLDGTVETNAKTTVDENNNTVYLVEDAKLSLNVNKTQLGNKDVEVEGARLELFDEEGNLVDFWISKKNETHDFGHKVQAGKKYTLKETVAPDGYGYVTDIVFEITKDGKVVTDAPFTTDEKGNKTFLVEDAKVKFNVNKVDLGNGDELEGAELVVIDKETGTVIDTWKSEIGKTHDFGDKLTAGKEYILRETVAPNGYEVTTDIEFRVENDGSITTTAKTTVDKDGNVTYLVQDQITTVKVNKIDAVDGRTLTGAHLQLLDETGKVVEEWDSAAQARELKGLVAGKTYTLHETIAPAGYVVNTVDVTLTLDAKGEIDKTKTTAKISEDGTVLVENNMVKSETASISVTKQLTYNGAPITAIDQTFYVALYVDAACTNRVSDIKPVVFKEASSSTVEFKGLDLGRMYYIGECDANGTSLVTGALADGTIYAANFAAGNQATVTDANGVTRITFENEFHELPAGFYKEGELTITKKLIGGDGEAVDSDEVFYAGIFADKNYKKLSDQVSQNIVELALNGGSEVSETIKVAVTSGQATKLYVTEVDADGNPVAGSAGFEYEVTVSKTSVSLDEEHTKASVTITSKVVEEETETEAEKKKETPKTGDETPIMPYLGLLLAAGFVLILGAYRRRRNAK